MINLVSFEVNNLLQRLLVKHRHLNTFFPFRQFFPLFFPQMVKSEETCLFRCNCFVRMTSADHEVTTGKLAPWGGWNEISYQSTWSSSFLHFVSFVICKAKEMFCSPWFFSSPLFFFPQEKEQYIRLVSPKSQLLLQVYLVPHSEVNDLECLLFLLHIRPSLTHHLVL